MTSFSRFTEFLNSQYYRNAGVGIGRKHLWWKIPLVISPFLFPDPIEWFPEKKVEKDIPQETVEWVHNELSSIPGMPMDQIELVQWKGGLFYGSSASPVIWRYFGHDKKKYHIWIPSKLDNRILRSDPTSPLELSVGGPTKLFLPPTPSDPLLIDRFALAHEAAHILERDSMKGSLFSAIGLGFVLAGPLNLMRYTVKTAVTFVGLRWYARFLENRADKIAARRFSNEQKEEIAHWHLQLYAIEHPALTAYREYFGTHPSALRRAGNIMSQVAIEPILIVRIPERTP